MSHRAISPEGVETIEDGTPALAFEEALAIARGEAEHVSD